MTNEELVAAIQNGQQELMSDLWYQNTGIIHTWARKYSQFIPRGDMDTSDLEQICYLAMDKAVKAYDPDCGAKFITTMFKYVQNEFSLAMGYHGNCKKGKYGSNRYQFFANMNSLNDIVSDDAGNKTELEQIAEAEEPQASIEKAEKDIYIQQLHDVLEDGLNRIPAEDALVLRMRYYDGMTLQRIADNMGCSPASADYLEHHGLRSMRRNVPELKEYRDSSVDPYKQSGLQSFQKTGMSVEERYVMQNRNNDIQDNLEKDIQYARSLGIKI